MNVHRVGDVVLTMYEYAIHSGVYYDIHYTSMWTKMVYTLLFKNMNILWNTMA